MPNVNSIRIADKNISILINSGQIIWPYYDSSTKDVIGYALDNSYKLPLKIYIDKLDKHIRDLKTAGLWNKMDLAYWMVGDSDMNFKCINIINPEMSGTPVGGLINTLQGIEGNRIDGYVDSNIPVNDPSNIWKLKDAGVCYYTVKSGNRPTILGLMAPPYNLRVTSGAAGSTVDTRINAISSSWVMPIDTDLGFASVSRVGDNFHIVNNTTEAQLETVTSAELSSLNFLIGRNAAAYFNVELAFISIGSAITGQDATNLRQAILNNL